MKGICDVCGKHKEVKKVGDSAMTLCAVCRKDTGKKSSGKDIPVGGSKFPMLKYGKVAKWPQQHI